MVMNSISVKNYRGINKFKLDEINKINILIGKNNSGKSALLECIALLNSGFNGWYDALGDDILNKIIMKRGGWKYSKMMIKMGEDSAEINGTIDGMNNDVFISQTYKPVSETSYQHIIAGINEYYNEVSNFLNTRTNRTYDSIGDYGDENKTIEFERKKILLEKHKESFMDNLDLIIQYNTDDIFDYEYALLMSDIILDELRHILETPYFTRRRKIIRRVDNRVSNILLCGLSVRFISRLR